MSTYGNNLKTVKHVSKIGLLLGLFVLIIFIFLGYKHGNFIDNLDVLIFIPFFTGSILPLMVGLSAIFNIEIIDNEICLLVIGKYRFNAKPINMISSINIGSLLTIYFEDGTTIRTTGMYIPEYYRLVEDIRSKSTKKIQVKSHWLSFN